MKKLEIPKHLQMKWESVIDYPARCKDIAKYLKYSDFYNAFNFVRNNFDMSVFSILVESFIQRLIKDYGKENAIRISNLIRKGKLDE